MGSFSNTIFSILLGWLQTLVSAIWSAFTDPEGASFFKLIGNNWIRITAILCIVGLLADFAVYLFRWEPYKVWKSFWHRIRKSPAKQAGEDDREIYFRISPEEEDEAVKDQSDPDQYEEKDDLQKWRGRERDDPENAAEPEISKAGYVIPADSPYRRPGTYTESSDFQTGQGLSRRRRNRLSSFLGDADDAEPYRYSAPKPMIDQEEAYHAPVYPEKWKESRDRDS